MYQIKLRGALVLFVISIGVRSQSREDGKIILSNSDLPTYDHIDRPTQRLIERGGKPEYMHTLRRRQKESHNAQLRDLIVRFMSLRPKLDSDFRARPTLPPTRKFVSFSLIS